MNTILSKHWREIFNKDKSLLDLYTPVDLSDGANFLYAHEKPEDAFKIIKELPCVSPFTFSWNEVRPHGETLEYLGRPDQQFGKGITLCYRTVQFRYSLNDQYWIIDYVSREELSKQDVDKTVPKLYSKLRNEWWCVKQILTSISDALPGENKIHNIFDEAETDAVKLASELMYIQIVEFRMYSPSSEFSRHLTLPMWTYGLGLDNDGKIIAGWFFDTINEMTQTMDNKIGNYFGKAKQIQFVLLRPYLFSLALLHCKNIEITNKVESTNTAEAGPKKFFQDYRVLEVKPFGKTKKYEVYRSGSGIKKGQHLVRGHFRTYTEDKPLFGRVVGTFFVPPHIRGDAEIGIIDKKYKEVI